MIPRPKRWEGTGEVFRNSLRGRTIGVFGLGRTGIGVARAGLQFGARVTVFEQASREAISKPELLEELDALGVDLFDQWDGVFEGSPPDLLIVNPAIDHRHSFLQNLTQKGLTIWSEIELAYRISLAPIIAITGTNGKTTTTAMTYVALQGAGVEAVLCGNIFGSGLPEMPMIDAALTATESQVLVAEVSSFQLEWIDQFCPRIAVITNITPDHLDRYDSFEDYRATKLRISLRHGPRDTLLRPELDERSHDESFDSTRLQVIGKHNVQNAETAYRVVEEFERLLAPEFGLTISRGGAKAALYAFAGVDHRMEIVGTRDGITVINNSMCTNPAAVKASVEALQGKAHVLIGGKNKELDFSVLKPFFESRDDELYLFGSHRHAIAESLGGKMRSFETLEQAFQAATRDAQQGTYIILAPGCASTDQFRDFRERGDVFRSMARGWIG